jgi:hypothetical protein
MASEQEVYVGDLPQLGEILAGDFLFIITPTGEYILDFKNFIISEDNISFAQRLDDFDTSIIDLSATVLGFQDTITIYSANFQALCAELASVSASLLADVDYLSTALVTTSAALVSYTQAATANFTPYFAYLSYGISLSGNSPVSPAIKYSDYNINSVVVSYDPAGFVVTLVVNFIIPKSSENYVALPTFTGTIGENGLNTNVKGVSSVKTANSATFYVGFSANVLGRLYFDALFL